MKRIGSCLAAIVAVSGCAVVDPDRVGNGQYLQVFDTTGVFVETDSSRSGLQACPTTAYATMQQNPGLRGKIRCSSSPSVDSLPYTFKAWNRSTPQGDEKLLSSPFSSRFRDSNTCRSTLSEIRLRPNMEVLEDFCVLSSEARTSSNRGEAAKAADVPARRGNPSGGTQGRRLTIYRLDAPVMQILTKDEKECAAIANEHAALLQQEASGPGFRYGCVNANSSTSLPFEAKLRDELFDTELTVRAVTEVLCRSTLASIAKIRPSNLTQARYRVDSHCHREQQ